jgi:anti-anti-sigma factor
MAEKRARVPTSIAVAFSGEYDLACRAQLRDEFASVARVPHLILDFTKVTYLDSTIIVELMRLSVLRCEHGCNEAIIVANATVARLFRLVKLETLFRVVDSLEEAVGANDRTEFRCAFAGLEP